MTTVPKWHLLKGVTVESHAPEKADMPHLLHRAGGDHGKMQRVVHHVTLHLPEPLPAHSTGYRLWIGDHPIDQYSAVQDGISFRVHDTAELAALYGQPIRFVSDHGIEFRSGVTFPDLSRHRTGDVGRRWQKVFRR